MGSGRVNRSSSSGTRAAGRSEQASAARLPSVRRAPASEGEGQHLKIGHGQRDEAMDDGAKPEREPNPFARGRGIVADEMKVRVVQSYFAGVEPPPNGRQRSTVHPSHLHLPVVTTSRPWSSRSSYPRTARTHLSTRSPVPRRVCGWERCRAGRPHVRPRADVRQLVDGCGLHGRLSESRNEHCGRLVHVATRRLPACPISARKAWAGRTVAAKQQKFLGDKHRFLVELVGLSTAAAAVGPFSTVSSGACPVCHHQQLRHEAPRPSPPGEKQTSKPSVCRRLLPPSATHSSSVLTGSWLFLAAPSGEQWRWNTLTESTRLHAPEAQLPAARPWQFPRRDRCFPLQSTTSYDCGVIY
ncbi:hypothetical protein PSPO01_04779 [Paraphaeosphaeria sporulosa]